MPQAARYLAHTDAGHCHILEARSFEDAAMSFAEAHAPMAEDDALRVIVQSEDGGPEHCFVIHLDSETVEACA
ncbi:MAG: hypothetical protein KKA16_13820 [Alphaproteobacteria bacterium]|nr:hypothetical protein [Alphaproteobacteria bacterium]MBU2378261.1 hypothetical protein [Alphaproteobacteria bacterium]